MSSSLVAVSQASRRRSRSMKAAAIPSSSKRRPGRSAVAIRASPMPRCASPTKQDEFSVRDYTADDMFRDLMRISSGRANEDLIRTLCDNARQTADWLTDFGLEWEAGYPHTAGYRRSPKSGGQGLVDLLFRRLEGFGVTCTYETGALRTCSYDPDGCVRGIRARGPEGIVDIVGKGGVDPRLRRLPGERRDAGALPRPLRRLAHPPRQPLQHRRRPEHGDGRGRRSPPASGATTIPRSSMPAARRSSAASRPSTTTRWASSSTATASASSTRAKTSATTPT